MHHQNPSTTQLPSELPAILQAESNFLNLKSQVETTPHYENLPPFLKEIISLPFQILAANQENHSRPFSDFCRNLSTNTEIAFQLTSQPLSYLTAELPNPSMFLLSADGGASSTTYASFKPSCRLLLIGADNTTPAGLSVLFHELVHVAIDNTERSQIVTTADFNQYLTWEYPLKESTRPRCRVPDECWAYGMQIELLNILLDGRLEKGIQQTDYLSIAEDLGATGPLSGTI